MLRMPPFEVHRPGSAAEAVALRHRLPQARYIAGGTDLLPNLKHHLDSPSHLVALGHLDELRQVVADADGRVSIGAAVTLAEAQAHVEIRRSLPALAQAAGLVAGPQHRRMGTLGGNVLLDTRCLFYNQTRAWRQALGSCLKAEGTWCHVIGSARGCVAAQSSDTVPVLIAADAQLRFLEPDGDDVREVGRPIRDLYGTDGRRDQMHRLPAGSLLVGIELTPPAPGHRSVYRKVRRRGAVDFPQLGVAAVASLDDEGTCTALAVALGALLPRPTLLRGTDDLVGTRLDDEAIAAFAIRARKQARPQPQVHGDPTWRRHRVEVEVQRALLELRAPYSR